MAPAVVLARTVVTERFQFQLQEDFFLWSDLFIIVFSELQNNEWGETVTVLQAWGSQVILEFQINKGPFLDVWWNLPQNILATSVYIGDNYTLHSET